MKCYTLRDLGMNVSGEKFLLPFDVDDKEDTILEKTVKIICDAEIYERTLLTDRDENDQVKVNKWGDIETKCLYEGYDGYYPFTMVMEVFRFNAKQETPSSYGHSFFYDIPKPMTIYCGDEKVKNGQWMVALTIEQEKGALLEELIELKVMPSVIQKLNLKQYSYK